MPKLLFLSGSTRKGSFNKKLTSNAVLLAREIGGAGKITHINLDDYPMPIYNGDLEKESGMPGNAKKLKKLFIESTGFFIASPEYNGAFSPLLKNTIDWITRSEEKGGTDLTPFQGKVAAICSASPGALGGYRGLVLLRLMLSNIYSVVIPEQFALSEANDAFDSDDNLIEKKNVESLTKVVSKFIETATLYKK